MYYVYMLKNSYDDLYVGISEKPNKRLVAHNKNQGANFTKNNKNFALVFLEEYGTLTEARKREMQIKKWRRDKKEFLIEKYFKKLETK